MKNFHVSTTKTHINNLNIKESPIFCDIIGSNEEHNE